MANESSKLKTQNAKVEDKMQNLPKEKVVKAKAEKKVVVKEKPAKVEGAATAQKTTVKSSANLTVDVYGLDGKVTGSVNLPAELFGAEVNKTLLAQAVRVYLANQRQGNASTKTRGEVDGSTRKIYKQKGTGRARHGSVRAPIFVKGGIVFGPKPRDFGLTLPTKMKRKALASALSAKVAANTIRVVSGFEKIEPKTKAFVSCLEKLALYNKKKTNVLVVTVGQTDALKKAARNVPGIVYMSANRLNAYEVLKHTTVLIMQDAIAEIQKTVGK